MGPPSAPTAEHYPIRAVASLTGVNAVTLRAWERRYGLVKPMRTAGGQRMYTRADIDAIHRVLAMLEKGVAISQVPRDLAAPSRAAGNATARRAASPWLEWRARMVAAVSQFDEDRLEDTYDEVLALYPSDVVTARLLVPLLVELGERWRDATGSVAEEHFFGVYLRNKLGARFHHRARRSSGPRLLAACLPGEQHEAGLLLFALAAHEQGFRPVLLGADMPLAELPPAAARSRSDAVVLSGSMPPRPGLFEQELPALVAGLHVPVFVGGARSVRDGEAIAAAGATPLGDDIARGLKRIGEALGPART